jgi:proline racemase
MLRRIRTIDAHTAGEPLRLVVDGFPTPAGQTMGEKRAWLKKHADALRRALLLEPRGHTDMYGALLTEPVSAGADAGLLFMHNEGYSTMCGHGTIAVTTIALERHLLRPKREDEIVFDSPAGLVRARPRIESRPTIGPEPGRAATGGASPASGGAGTGMGDTRAALADPAGAPRVRVSSVAFTNVPSFVYEAGVTVRLQTRALRADVAFAGAFYAIVDAEAAGLPIEAASLPDLRRIGLEIKRAVQVTRAVVHPLDPGLCGLHGTIFVGPAHSAGADLRNVTVFADGQVDRSPCGTGTAAVLAVLDAMSLLPASRALVQESLIGTVFRARVIGRETVGGYDAIVPEIEGSAWITGEHEFLIDDEDPLREGFRV